MRLLSTARPRYGHLSVEPCARVACHDEEHVVDVVVVDVVAIEVGICFGEQDDDSGGDVNLKLEQSPK